MVSPAASPTVEPTKTALFAPRSAYLSELMPLGDSGSVAALVAMGGTTYVRSVAMSSGGCQRNQNSSYDWVVNNQYATLATTVGLDDRTVAAASVQIQILLDGNPAFNQTVHAGTIVPVSLNVSDARQITFEETYLGPDPNLCSEDATAVWADPLLKEK